MINIDQIRGFFPPYLAADATYQKYMLKEYIQLMILDYLSATSYIRKVVFIGGTNLRLVKGIDRFSEDLDFDCKDLSQEEFVKMTDDIITFLHRSGFNVEARDRENPKLKAFRRNLYFPGLLFELGLSGYTNEKFLIKVESQDQGFNYLPQMAHIKRAGFFFPIPVPPDTTLCAMKLSALLTRQKGRDFYDAIYLLSLVEPDYDYLANKCAIHNREELKIALRRVADTVDMNKKHQDFQHLLFNKTHASKVLRFKEFIEEI